MGSFTYPCDGLYWLSTGLKPEEKYKQLIETFITFFDANDRAVIKHTKRTNYRDNSLC
ncbi:hypothetical protein VCHA37P200_10597 [Vibrio chagasii]|nr:hypothetical protein VCHA34P126_100137 [Vibrio chagasii]CAH6797862.1 hypothetical protein VCHA36P161_100059 [Vibrio chagasii]CAH6844347.1 hypothetical protein VCHA29O39_10060 [Vibrio chagasii]CAH6895315.1 hypothetical protein VCHA40O235_100142 [Vibrio chagasii]CAH6911630.1 hypothetical protein VCHA48P434_100146 [Vibrio chagasii]